MKSALRLFYVALVGAVVFMGALYIAEGMRMRGGQAHSAELRQTSPSPFNLLEQEEGSAL